MFLFFVLILSVLIAFFFPEIKKEAGLLKEVQPGWLIAALGGQILTYLLTGMEYKYLLSVFNTNENPGIRNLSKAAVISLCFNQTLPSAGISGNLFYFQFLQRFNISKGKIFSLVIEELLIYYASMELFIIFLLCIFKLHAWSSIPLKTTLLSGFFVYPVLGVLILLMNSTGTISRLYKKAVHTKWLKKIFKLNASEFHLNERIELGEIIKQHKQVILKAYVIKLLVSMADIFTLYVIFLGIGFTISPFFILAAYVATNIISLLPFAPGALVLYESSMTYFFVSMGIPMSPAIIVTLVYRLLSFWLPMPIGTFMYRKWLHAGHSKQPDAFAEY